MKKRLLFILLFLAPLFVLGESIKGRVLDKQSKEPLFGATVFIPETNKGVIVDINGEFELAGVKSSEITLKVSYVGYKPLVLTNIPSLERNGVVEILMENEAKSLDEVVVKAKGKNESESVLNVARMNSSIAVENMGSKEMAMKGIGNVAEGVKKISGISFADGDELFVRGLGDRYSITTLNGLPIASPNPDNKLVPLDLFPSSIVENITVSKVYKASTFADYSGAHVNIVTQNKLFGNSDKLKLSIGGDLNTTGKAFYHSSGSGVFSLNNRLDAKIKSMSPSAFNEYVQQKAPFSVGFDVNKGTALPNMGIGYNKEHVFHLGDERTLSMFLSLSGEHKQKTIKDAFSKSLNKQGDTKNDYTYDTFTSEFNGTGMLGLGYATDKHAIDGLVLFTTNRTDEFKHRYNGYEVDYSDFILTGIHNTSRFYDLLNTQLGGEHAVNEKMGVNWKVSYITTSSMEPDRRQVMYTQLRDAETKKFFTQNSQETMRYYGDLSEKELSADVRANYEWNKHNNMTFGVVGRKKDRDYFSENFYYDLKKYDDLAITDIYKPGVYISNAHLHDGSIKIIKDNQPKNKYKANNVLYGVFVENDYKPSERILLNVGLRFEYTKQTVDYSSLDGIAHTTDLSATDVFPALNLKVSPNTSSNMRLSLSRTITRPSFLEMTPFSYKENYGGAMMIGNEDIKNGYNYNVDLRYERFFNNNKDLVSLSGYYKYLSDPIESVQNATTGTSIIYSFINSSKGTAMGLELELRKTLAKTLKVNLNASYIYTNVVLPEGAIYSQNKRALQGASPYLMNADLVYAPVFSHDRQLTMSLVYNLQGPRIQLVGINKMKDVIQESINTLDFNGGYAFNKKCTLSVKFKDLLQNKYKYTQKMLDTNKKVTVKSYRPGMEMSLGFSYQF